MTNINTIMFTAYVIAKELDLNAVALAFGIPKKLRWDEPLILQSEPLKTILNHDVQETQKVILYSFGSVVFVNLSTNDNMFFVKHLSNIVRDIDLKLMSAYTENYELHIDSASALAFTDKYLAVPTYEEFYSELIATCLAKSVALERIEEHLEIIMDTLENIIDVFEKRAFFVLSKSLAKATTKIVRYEYNTIAYIMILDKPDITWSNNQAAEFYTKMAKFFELDERYDVIKKKTSIIKNIMSSFFSISYSMRGMFVEWVIVTLILGELIISLINFLR